MSRLSHGFNDESESDDPRVFAAVKDYLAALEAGRRPNRREFIARHQEIAGKLGACLDGLAFVHSAAGQMGSEAGAPKQPEIDSATAQPLGDFRLVRQIGRGGMGTVYEAIQLSLGRRVALKVLPMAAALDARHLERFRNEASAAAQLHHMNIVPVYAVGCERSVHFYAMQLIEGQSLEEVIRDVRSLVEPEKGGQPRGPVSGRNSETIRVDRGDLEDETIAMGNVASPSSDVAGITTSGGLSTLRASKRGTAYARSVANLGLQVAEALDYAHRAGIVHRDIKPANLLLDARGTVWITDFGLAVFFQDAGLTRSGDMVGTLRYMSPEQASGRAVVLDQRTDIYSLGVTLYELLTLQRAHPGTTHQALLYQVTHVEPRPPRAIDRTIPRELEIILGKAMSKDPADRYQTAQGMADDLRRFLKDEPITARPPTTWDKAWKWTRRHKAWAFAGVAVITLAAIGLLVSTLLIAREQANTHRAYEAEQSKTIEARQQRALAEQSWAEAREAVDFFSGVAIGMDRPQFSEVRRDMLEESLAYYQDFIERRKGDPTVSGELEAAQRRVASYLDLYAALDAAVRADGRILLLNEPSVRAALNLAGAEETAALELVTATMSSFPSPGPTTAASTPDARKNQFAERAKKIDAALMETLGAARAERLRQISRQIRGSAAFSDPDVVERLGLTRDQRSKIRDLRVAYRNSRMRPHGAGDEGDHGGSSAADDGSVRIIALLTSDQVATWRDLIGPAFTGRLVNHGPRDDFMGPPMGGRHSPHSHGGSDGGAHGPSDGGEHRGSLGEAR